MVYNIFEGGPMVFKGVSKVTNTRTIEEAEKIIDKVFKGLGLKPDKAKIDSKDVHGWAIKRGSAIVYIFLNENKYINTLRIVSPLLYLPKKRQNAFLRKCLEYNYYFINCALGLNEDLIFLVEERPLTGLDPEEVEYIINNLSRIADRIDNELARKYDAQMYRLE